MDFKTITLETSGPVACLTLNRPAKRNAVNDAMIREIAEAFATGLGDAAAVVLTGAGSSFSAGLDLAEHALRDAEQAMAISAYWHRVIGSIGRGPPVVVAALSGHVIGGGLEIAAAAHIRIAEADCKFALPEGRRGIFVGGGASVNVGRLIGASRLMEIMLTGRVVDAEEALRIGLVHRLVPPGTALDTARSVAMGVAQNAPLSNLMMLQAIPRIAAMAPTEGLFTESLAAALAQSSPEAKARMTAFLDKHRA